MLNFPVILFAQECSVDMDPFFVLFVKVTSLVKDGLRYWEDVSIDADKLLSYVFIWCKNSTETLSQNCVAGWAVKKKPGLFCLKACHIVRS